MEEKDIIQPEEVETKRSPIVRVLAVLGAIAVPIIAYLLFRYGYLMKI